MRFGWHLINHVRWHTEGCHTIWSFAGELKEHAHVRSPRNNNNDSHQNEIIYFFASILATNRFCLLNRVEWLNAVRLANGDCALWQCTLFCDLCFSAD